MNYNLKNLKADWLSYGSAYVLILTMIISADYLGDKEVILPELAAMVIAVICYREKSWMRQPEKLFVLPTITAVLGFLINDLSCHYIAKVFGILLITLCLFYIFNFSLAPSLATGFLPIVTDAHSYYFLLSIIVSTFLLSLIVYLFKLNEGVPRRADVDLNSVRLYFIIMITWMIIISMLGYERLVVIPPIAVVVYESVNMKIYTGKMAIKQTIVLVCSSILGVTSFLYLHNMALIATIDLAAIFLLLNVMKMRMPAAYAFPLLAFVLPADFLQGLPIATLGMCMFTLGSLVLYRTYYSPKESKSF